MPPCGTTTGITLWGIVKTQRYNGFQDRQISEYISDRPSFQTVSERFCAEGLYCTYL